ncbi:TniQ family protein [Nostocoides australiense]
MTAALPVSVAPRPGESIESWLEHLADANGLTTAQLLTATGQGRASARYLTLAPSPETIARLAALARVDEQDVYAATLAAFDGTALDLTGLDPGDRHSYRQVAARGWAPAHGTQICPACLGADGAWQSAWRLLIVTTCTRHEALLVARCPSCRRAFRDQRHSHLRRVGAALVCGNPLSAGPTRQCQHDLTTIPSAPASEVVLAVASRVDIALAGQEVTVLGQAAQPAAYLTDLRHLTTLLLHLAGQPGATQLTPWVDDLAGEADARSRERGPRWGLRPPEQPRLRASALAAADGILTAPDVDEAAARLTPWTEVTPTTNDGPLGWLADRTVMTPTLTRLVMAARAPHRRMSHHLDNHLGGRMPINVTLIPQVIPHAQYLEHLDGASTSSEDTVRLFASLSLARLHPNVTSWAAAAEALNMPGPMGVRCARACSATMRVTADEWTSRIWRAGEEIERRDYRATETKIEHRLHMTRWFEEWARQFRPGTHYSSVKYGLTWQWVHAAHAHLDLSPAWRGKRPTVRDRARYRQFETSLVERQKRGLVRAVEGGLEAR